MTINQAINANSVEHLIEAATRHGQESEPDHEIGDLQQFLRLAWEIMTPAQCERLLADAQPWE
jgi:hypothetical protein